MFLNFCFYILYNVLNVYCTLNQPEKTKGNKEDLNMKYNSSYSNHFFLLHRETLSWSNIKKVHMFLKQLFGFLSLSSSKLSTIYLFLQAIYIRIC